MIKEPKLLTFGLNPFQIGGHSISTLAYWINNEIIFETRILDDDGEAFIEHSSEDAAKEWHLSYILNTLSEN